MVLKTGKKIYIIGIKGTGTSSLAVLLKKMGYRVTGSDTAEKFFTESQLKKNNIRYFESFDAAHVVRTNPDLVIVSTAYNDRNPEVAQAKLARLPLWSYPQAIGEVSKELTSIAVCGSHGKTTTTSMLGFIMQANGRTMTLTGSVADFLNKKLSRPEFFVFEADEYQNKLQYYSPDAVILTNVDFDHPDYFKDKKHYRRVFREFVERILKNGGRVLYNSDDPETRRAIEGLGGLPRQRRGKLESYGFRFGSDYLVRTDRPGGFSVFMNGKRIFQADLTVYGKHNALNASAAAVTALAFGIKPKTAQSRLRAFKGVKRRMEVVPNKKYIVIDDYGHHPTEVAATLAALRTRYPNEKIFTVFHPHTFTRTKALLKEFGRSFGDSDMTLVLDIYPSAREVTGTISSSAVVAEIKWNGSKAVHTPHLADAAAYIKKHARKGDIVLTIGAGDVWKIHKLLA